MSASFSERFLEVARVAGPGRGALSERTIKTYRHWLRLFFLHTGKKPAAQWCGRDVSRWMYSLKAAGYAGKSRNQALCAVIFALKHVLHLEVGVLDLPTAEKVRPTLKVIPTRPELSAIFAGLKGQARMMAAVIYGGGLRVQECCELRVKDLDFANLTIRVHSGKGDKDRLTLLPMILVEPLRKWVAWRAALHERDLAEGAGAVELPGRLSRKYPSATRELGWQFVFPSVVVREGYRWHAVPEGLQKALRKAVKAAGIVRPVTPHTLRHAFATHALQAGNDVTTIQDMLGHEHLDTTMIYLHADRARGISPLDLPPPEISPRMLPTSRPVLALP
jgi:integron integrase